MSTDDAQEEYVSGPYCPHWSEAGFCDLRCTCGHTCSQHTYEDFRHDVPGVCDRCECKQFTLAVTPT